MYKDALNDYNKALELDIDDPGYLYHRGTLKVEYFKDY